tara:strand:- start:707 stop:955 length:249 start_codon:yes stop_codon:yes gene_type:complete
MNEKLKETVLDFLEKSKILEKLALDVSNKTNLDFKKVFDTIKQNTEKKVESEINIMLESKKPKVKPKNSIDEFIKNNKGVKG